MERENLLPGNPQLYEVSEEVQLNELKNKKHHQSKLFMLFSPFSW